LTDYDAVDAFASQCNVITLEFENIPSETIARCSQYASTFPAATVLATTQDRFTEKSTLSAAGLPVTPFATVHDNASLIAAGETLGWPMIVKTTRDGYDGKGQYRVHSADDVASVPWSSAGGWIAESFIPFDLEISVIVARREDGRCEAFPAFENSHANHILDISVVPARISEDVAAKATMIAQKAAATLGVVGLLCVEFFVSDDNLMINEVAPRPHNSGHLTIEACPTSQFEQHVRAVCGLPLGCTDLRVSAAAMANLLGDVWKGRLMPPWDRVAGHAGVSLHLYGKRHAVAGRKMCHLTTPAATADAAIGKVKAARAAIG
jgi:5-(carboxyamino)imidazole ribonucleotide synthase